MSDSDRVAANRKWRHRWYKAMFSVSLSAVFLIFAASIALSGPGILLAVGISLSSLGAVLSLLFVKQYQGAPNTTTLPMTPIAHD